VYSSFSVMRIIKIGALDARTEAEKCRVLSKREKDDRPLQRSGVDGWQILTCYREKQSGRVYPGFTRLTTRASGGSTLDSRALGQGPVEGCCRHDNKVLGNPPKNPPHWGIF
jgi:hypothetical protein